MSDVRQLIDESWQELMDALSDVPDDRLEEPGAVGEWSAKDLMAHLAFWDDRAVEVVDTLAAGRAVEPIDWQAANEREAAIRAGWTLEQCRREMEAAHQRVLQAVERYPELDAASWEGNTFDHYREHAADIRAWRGDRL